MKAGSEWDKAAMTTPWHILNDTPPKATPQAAYTPPPAPSPDKRWAILALVTLAATLGIVVFAAANFIPPPSVAAPTAAPTLAPQVVYVDRLITATAMPPQPTAAPVVVIVTAPPPVQAQGVAQPRPAERQAVRSLPAPTQAPPPPVAWPAPATSPKRAVYVCADGAEFPQDDSRWAWGIFGQWHMQGSGDRVDIRDSFENNSKMGWHYGCQRVWR